MTRAEVIEKSLSWPPVCHDVARGSWLQKALIVNQTSKNRGRTGSSIVSYYNFIIDKSTH